VLLDRNEGTLAALHAELGERFPRVRALALLCDVRNARRVREILAEHRPEIVYHAAAYKHVPMMEMNPIEAVKNNVLGTRDLLAACDTAGVDKFVLISTDKAVRPINIMGATKRVAERLIEDAVEGGCRRIAVRFGNVLGSEGSVLPILLRQIREGGPVTVTHPEATRYFMTIPEAVQLVLQASAIGAGGEIFVLEMGEPVRILDLATSLIRLAGLQPERDIEIRITGLRPGERLHEETLIDSDTRPTGTDKLWVRPANGRGAPIASELAELERLVHRQDEEAILGWLRRVAEPRAEQAA
jgi:FlaA1/EpsC-like NDP-sugar epimerase